MGSTFQLRCEPDIASQLDSVFTTADACGSLKTSTIERVNPTDDPVQPDQILEDTDSDGIFDREKHLPTH